MQLKVPPQVAGTWYSLAMAASDISLLDAQSAPLRVYVEELKPTPEGDLEILLQKWWASPPKTWNPHSPGLWTPPGWGAGGTRAPGPGNGARSFLVSLEVHPRLPIQGFFFLFFSTFINLMFQNIIKQMNIKHHFC